MSKLINEISVFFPTYNEEGNIENVVGSAKKVLEKIANRWEIIIVDDGSKDNTPRISDEIAKSDSRIKVIHHKVNRGYGGALKTGFENAKYPWVVFTDSDGQFDFADVKKLIAKKDEADLILGVRKKRADSFARKVFTFGWATLARAILGLKAKDYSCGFKMIKKKVYEEIQPLVGEEKVTQIEMLVKARKKKFKFVEVDVNHYPRKSGHQTGANLKVVFKSVFDMFKLWGKMHNVTRREVIIILIVIAVGAFLRLYKIDQFMTFLGDEGRDVIIVRRLLVYGDPILIGPGTSIGNMYLGPLYYYMMAPALLLANFSPVGPAVQIALLGVVTILIIWWMGREWFGKYAGLIAAVLYAISPTVITFSRSSWNPNIMPFFALIFIYSIWRVWQKHEYKWLVVLGTSFAFALQSHYLALLLGPTAAIFLLLTLKDIWPLKEEVRMFFKNGLIGAAILIVLMSPLAIFDARHDWRNTNALVKFFGERQTTVSAKPWNALPKTYPLFEKINTRLLTATNKTYGKYISLFMVISLVYFGWQSYKLKKKSFKSGDYILFCWFLFALVGLGLYKQEIYDHYYGFFFPVPFLIIGAISQKLISKSKLFVSVLILALVVINLASNPLRYSPNRQLQRSEVVADKILSESAGKPFDLAVLAERNYEDGYRYFLEVNGATVLHADQWDKSTIADTLFVVCEMEKNKCDPTHSPKAEVANFGWSKIDNEWDIAGVILYKLSHSR